jgi:hypothetical protein
MSASDSNPDLSASAELQCDFVQPHIGLNDDIVGFGMATTVPGILERGNRHESSVVLFCKRSYRHPVNCTGECRKQKLGHHHWQLFHHDLANRLAGPVHKAYCSQLRRMH